MTSFGYSPASEEHGLGELVACARRAEEAGFGCVSISDQYHPWVSAQGHSPFVWSVLGSIAAVTERLQVGVGVTCPTIRIHPSVLAQATATTSLLFGDFYEVENAKLSDPPPPPIIVAGFGTHAVRLAARIGDGYWGHTPERDILDLYRDSGGTGPRYAQLKLCWAEDAAVARKTVHEVWPNAGIPGQLSQDLPTWTHFEQAAQLVTEDDATGSVPCGPDLGAVMASVGQFINAGYDHLYFHQIGPDQDGFFRFWTEQLQPALADLSSEHQTT